MGNTSWIDLEALRFEQEYRRQQETLMNPMITAMRDMVAGTNKNDSFRLYFGCDCFRKNDIITTVENVKLIVVNTPRRKWYWLLLQYITFGLFKASVYYTVTILNKKDN